MPLEFYKKFKVNDKVISYASLNPRVEPRLQEIYRKFSEKLTEYSDELKGTFVFGKGKFDPKKAREDLDARNKRKEMLAKLQETVEKEVDRVYAKKETKERKNIVFSNQNSKKRTIEANQDIETSWLRSSRAGLNAMNEDLDGLLVETLEPPDEAMPSD